MIERTPVLLTSFTTFYDLSVSCSLFSKAEMRQFGANAYAIVGNRRVKKSVNKRWFQNGKPLFDNLWLWVSRWSLSLSDNQEIRTHFRAGTGTGPYWSLLKNHSRHRSNCDHVFLQVQLSNSLSFLSCNTIISNFRFHINASSLPFCISLTNRS